MRPYAAPLDCELAFQGLETSWAIMSPLYNVIRLSASLYSLPLSHVGFDGSSVLPVPPRRAAA